MALPPAIERGPPDVSEPNYADLKKEGIGLVQAYSGDIWTDYNEHDPGVTILEQLCYALTETGYRTALPIADLLAGPDGSLTAVGPALHRPSQALPTEPVTILDYRRLLIDRVKGLGNVWLDPLMRNGESSGLYALGIYAAPRVPGIFERSEPDRHVGRRVERVFVRHRALCEDIGSIVMLEPVRTVVGAVVEVERSAWPEQIMAGIIQRLACYLAPEPRRRPLRELVEEGRSLASILEGPLPLHGFVEPADLGPPRLQVGADELGDEIVNSPGVIDLRSVGLWVEPDRMGEARLAPNQYFSLDSGLGSRILPIQLIADGHEVRVDSREVARQLRLLWEEHRRTYRLGPDFHRYYPAPRGQRPPGRDYVPVATQFPALYGLRANDLPATAPPKRIAEVRQLQAYLALFDRQMADVLDRTSGLAALLAAEPSAPAQTCRPADQLAPWMADILIDDGGGAAEDPLFTMDAQGRIADFLLGLYGENPDPLIVARPGRPNRAEEAGRHLAIKRAMLQRLWLVGKGRGRGLDYHSRRRSRRGQAGSELRSRIMLGSLTEVLGPTRPRLRIVEHVLLRPRCPDSCSDPVPADDAMRVTAVVHLPWEERKLAPHRSIERMIRANVPAHVDLRVFFVGRKRWTRFHRLHRLWLEALREDIPEALDCISAELRRRFDSWMAEPRQ